jgi:hypothetical protein
VWCVCRHVCVGQAAHARVFACHGTPRAPPTRVNADRHASAWTHTHTHTHTHTQSGRHLQLRELLARAPQLALARRRGHLQLRQPLAQQRLLGRARVALRAWVWVFGCLRRACLSVFACVCVCAPAQVVVVATAAAHWAQLRAHASAHVGGAHAAPRGAPPHDVQPPLPPPHTHTHLHVECGLLCLCCRELRHQLAHLTLQRHQLWCVCVCVCVCV